MRTFLFAACCWFVVGTSLRAEEPKSIDLLISPRAIETPVLKYRLLPAEADLKSGNAAPILLRLPWEQNHFINNVYPKLDLWELHSLSSPEWKKFPGTLPDAFYDAMKRAAYRRSAEWEFPIGEQPAYFIVLPDVQGLGRVVGYGLSAKAKYHLSRGELEQAREAIQIGLANGRHLAHTPFLIVQVVAAHIHQRMLDRITELMAQPDSPNLYWALSTLPSSLLQINRAADLEGSVFSMTAPGANDLDRPREVAEWKRMADQLLALLEQVGELPPVDQKKAEPAPVTLFETARRELSQLLPSSPEKVQEARRAAFFKSARSELPQLLHLTPEKVKAMSDDEAGIRWFVQLRTISDQQISAVMRLPPREAEPRIRELQADLENFHKKTGLSGRALNPVSIYVSLWGVSRKIQSLRIIEAVRHYAATHDGKLPEQLSDIKDLSIPHDPFTDQPFDWKRDADGRSAILRDSKIPYDPGTKFRTPLGPFEYRLRVRTSP